jgi:cysteinyl-tRNA synthetase
VERVLVFTDIEDKAVAEAEKQGIEVNELTDGIANQFHKESKLLKLKAPTYNPRSSTTVDQAVKIIKILMEKGIAYRYKDDVFYDPLKFKGFGKLYGLDMSRWPKKKKRFKLDTYPGMQWNLGDFIIWRGCEADEKACFDKELGFGRPAWNVQDPAMAMKYLGSRVDISCGGIDNLYRHHDYTLAIVEGVTGKRFSNYWLHGGHLFVNGKKMSKSKGTIIYPEHILNAGYTRAHLRFYLLYGRYREKLNYTEKSFKEVSQKLDKLKKMVRILKKSVPAGINSHSSVQKLINNVSIEFKRAMNDDLNVTVAFEKISKIISKFTDLKTEGKVSLNDSKKILRELKGIDEVLQIIF